MANKLMYLVMAAASIAVIYFAVTKGLKQNKKWSTIAIVFFALLGLGSIFNLFGIGNPAKTTPSQTSSSVTSKPATKKTPPINRVKLGMSKDKVIKLLGNPDDDSGKVLTWNKYGIMHFDDGGKLIGGDDKHIQKQVDDKIATDKKNRADNQNKLEGFAQSFGRRPVDDIQKNPMGVKSTRIDGGMEYMEIVNKMEFLRIDTDDGYTTVYQYDSNAEDGLGQKLYTGKTILQKRSTIYNYYGE